MKVDPKQLKAFLLDFNLITELEFDKIQEEAQKNHRKIDDILIDKNFIEREELIKLKAHILGIPFVNLEKETISQETLQIIPEAHARKNNIIVFKKSEQGLEVAMLDPEDLQTIEFIKKKTNLKILPRLTSEDGLKHALQQYQKPLKTEFKEIIKTGEEELLIKSSAPAQEKDEKGLSKIAQELPIIKIVDTLLKHAILQKASDIHIEPSEKETIIRYRIDGLLHDAMILPQQINEAVVARIKVLSNLKIDEHRLPQDGRFQIETAEQKISFRISIIPVYNGEKIVLRILREDAKGLTLELLGLRSEALEIVHRNIKKPNGMILVTGPTGSGKTTTLYTVMDILNTTEVNIATVEDPIEYQMPRINQTQIQPKINLTFANGLRSLLRQDPDIIMVGEIRDNETAELAINAALTGHLVLSTLHTNSASGTIPRLLDMHVEPFLIASTLNCVIAQRLVRKLYPETKEKYHLSKTDIASLGKQLNLDAMLDALYREKIIPPATKWEEITFYKPKGSPECPDGYKGRIGIFEIIEVTDNIKQMIIKQTIADEIEKESIKQGMITILEDGFIKAVQGQTSIEEVLRSAIE